MVTCNKWSRVTMSTQSVLEGDRKNYAFMVKSNEVTVYSANTN